MTIDPHPKWLTAIPLVYDDRNEGFWTREAGLLCLGFRELGIDCRFVTLGEAADWEDKPLITDSLERLQSPDWWRERGAAGVVFYSWAAPRYEPVARAIKQGGSRLVLRLDSDGTNSPRVCFHRYLYSTYHTFKDAGKPLAGLLALAKTLLTRYVPSLYETGWHRHLDHADLIVIESALARERYRRLLYDTGRGDLAENLVVLPPQVISASEYDPATVKKPQVIAVGRWLTRQKDAPMLMRVLGRVLACQEDHEAVILGSGEALLHKLRSRLPHTVQSRISILGNLPHAELLRHYRESRIIFFPSRYEGFPNSAVEGLCNGCSVVGPAVIASMNACVAEASGTLACGRSEGHLSDALCVEIEAWKSGQRDPARLSARWRERSQPRHVAATILRCVSGGPP